ncbi:MAG: glycosyltransferase [Candidatus Altiarchaeales archaeon]|mgnify:CR=1 FL=1|nr:MAG: glycosyltransferase [Candidatus Altiarchaeales archaeon]
MKIQIFMCGEGLGHTSRCLAIGERFLKKGHEVIFSAYGYSKEHIEKSGYKTLEIPSEIKLVGVSGSLDMRDSIEETLKGIDPLAYPRVFNMIRKEKPDIVISDSYFMSAVASKMQDIPLIFILNQTNIISFFENRGIDVALVGKIVTRFSDVVLKYADRILIPDFPPPYTICAKNVPLKPEILEKTEFVGPLVRKKYREVKSLSLGRRHVFSMVGGFGYRERLFFNVISTAELKRDFNFTLVAGPNVDSEHLKDKIDKIGENVKVLSYVNDALPYIKGSDVIIAPGGHSTMMECLSFGKPLLSFPDMFHSEQQNNADMIEQLGVGKKMSYFTPPFMISECIDEALKLKKNCQKMRRFAQRLDAPERILKIAEELTEIKLNNEKGQ